MEFRRLFDIPLYQLLNFPQKVALSVRSGIKQESYSSQECLDQIMQVSAGALNKGLSRGDKVAIISKYSSPRWTFLDIGLQQIGIIPVPISPRHDDEILEYILKDANIKLALVDDREQYTRVKKLNEGIKHIKGIFTFESLPDIPSWEDFTSIPEAKHLEQYEASKAVTHEDDLATIVYTGGTTGKPNGVMLTHKNIVSNVKSILEALPLKASHTVVSILPQHHIFERMAIYTYLTAGSKIFYVKPSDTLMEDIKSIRPHYFTAVPDMLKLFYQGIVEEALKRPQKSQTWFLWALKQGRNYRDYGKLSLFYFFKLKLADLFVFRHWRNAFGGRIEGIVVGAESVSPSLARLFTAAGIDIREGYGMTETSPVISINRFQSSKVNFGTVGQAIEGVEIDIKEPKDEFGNGEIYVKGDNVMKGYWNDEEKTYEAIQYGWLKTGDLGRFTSKKGFLQIAGRKADVIQLSTGDKLNPAFIETQLLDSPYVGRCIVIGEGKPYAVALIVPYYINLRIYAQTHDLSFDSKEETLFHPQIKELFRKEILDINTKLSTREHIGKFYLLQHEWTIKTGELSPVLKKKRGAILEKYRDVIKDLYDV
ncbi:MAG: long-chain acyl-CoA synthetase [Maribacter sp.]|jgi:long-chain acyl-CoA synthetase